MSVPMRCIVFALVCFLFLGATGFAETEVRTKKTALEKALGRLRESIEGVGTAEELVIPKDTSQQFSVKRVQISGNSLISTAELLTDLPTVYVLEVKDAAGGVISSETYDFRGIIDLIVDPGESRSVSLRTIQGFTKYVLAKYQEKGYAGIYVYVPAKAVEGEARLVDEILPIEVLEGKVGKILVERYDFDRQKQEEGFLKEEVLRSWSPAQEGEVVNKKQVDDFVGLLNLNPDRHVSAVISRSTEADALDLSYDVYESDPWHWYLQVDNAGTKDRQWAPKLGAINTNLTGRDDRFSAMYQAPWEKGIEDIYAVFGAYEFPILTPRLRLNVYSGYSQFDIPAEGIDFLGNGSFFGSALSYNIAQIGGWFIDVTGSLSHEKSKVTPSLGIATDISMDLWGYGLSIHRRDRQNMGQTSLGFTSTENMNGTSDDAAVELREEDGDFTIYTFFASHGRYLDESKVNRLHGSARLITPDERLVPAKMTTFGGLYSVRGYEEDEIVADGGILLSAQYEFDLVKHGESSREQETYGAEGSEQDGLWLKKLAPLAFVDIGRAEIEDAVPGERKIRELASVGLGTILEIGDSFTGGFYYGWPVRSTPETDAGEGRLNVSLIYRF